MKVFAIRTKGKECYLPANKPSKTGGGYTHTEPKVYGGKFGPRLFPSKRSANMALNAWSKGKWDYIVEYGMDVWGADEREPELAPRRVGGRDKEDFEIVEFNLVEVN